MTSAKPDRVSIEKLQQIVSAILCVDDVPVDADFVMDLGADSLDTIEIIMEVEQQCHVAIDDDEAPKLMSVQALFDRVSSEA